jgi:cytoskeletal protein CcmA (bactofilin family)
MGLLMLGLLNAEEIDIKLRGCSFVDEIGGSNINVKRQSCYKSIFERMFMTVSGAQHNLKCNVVEGEDIYLEYTEAKVVRGKNVVIGPGCDIEKIEYSNSITLDDKSKVCNQEKVY